MKLLVSLKDLELDKYLKYTNSFLIGCKNLSVNYYEATIDEIEKLLKKYPNIELFVSLNKNMFSIDLNYLEKILIKLSKLTIKGLFFYDLSVLKINKELNLGLNLVVSQDHLITNYNICNYYFDHGVNYANLSSDITLEEIKEIDAKTNINLMVFLVGHLLVSHSKRKLVTNFYQFINKKKFGDYHLIKEKGQNEEYYIIDNNIGTNILTKKVLNANQAFLDLKDIISYGILDSNLMEEDVFLEILKFYSLNLNGKINNQEFIEKTDNLIKERHEGFFNRKTIYKVK